MATRAAARRAGIARQAADEMRIEGHGALGEAVEIRRLTAVDP
jgi:hypothetical protein